ncbi:hypothetical protein [Lacticaseibacillus zhaodongensis]|uniref:hypothetical protein n=1 Tax=Lacticaseibacillus zhaodongensis TaxID=2668065 RepID=UPI0012D30411|nr:hypothetical protein [Lacticaseibacillus zhaodongensis]
MTETMAIKELWNRRTGKKVSDYACEFKTDGTLLLNLHCEQMAAGTLSDFMARKHPDIKYQLMKATWHGHDGKWGSAQGTVIYVDMQGED